MVNKLENLIQSQIEYYRKRSSEYDEWFLRRGRYDYGTEINQQWFDEVKEVCQVLEDFNPSGDVLELACGTGWWTEQLARYAKHITAVDASGEVIAINQQRLKKFSDKLTYEQADLFQWVPKQQYDVIFFSFWLSHVPPQYFAVFWDMVRKALKPTSRVFFIDSLCVTTATAYNQVMDDKNCINIRYLNDGSKFSIVKIIYTPSELQKKLLEIGLTNIVMSQTKQYFLVGQTQK